MPAASELVLAVPDFKLDLLDLWSMRHCRLQTIIAKRNSSLGKVAVASVQLRSDLAFLEAVPECLSHLQSTGQASLAESLRAATLHKQAQLPARFWRLSLGAAEWRQFWHADSAIGSYSPGTRRTSENALQHLLELSELIAANDWLSALRSSAGLDESLQQLAHGAAGEILRDFEVQAYWLNVANQLTAGFDRQRYCYEGRAGTKAKLVEQLVGTHFAPGVQRRAVDLRRDWLTMRDLIIRLENSQLAIMPDAYKRWRRERDAIFARGGGATLKHVEYLQKLYSDCGLRAGSPATGVQR